MNSLKTNYFWKILYSLLLVRILLFTFKLSTPPLNPHQFRQTDTLAVGYRYFLRWKFEDFSWNSLIPAVLNSGDSYGYMQMEFPLLNLLAGVGFSISNSNSLVVVQLILLVLHSVLSFANYLVWKEIKIKNFLNLAPAFCVLSFFSAFDIYYSRFMPDVTAHLLVCLALGLSWKKPRHVLSFTLFSLGILIKPNAAVVLGIGLLHPVFIRTIFLNGPWIICGLSVLYLYYGPCLSYIASLQTQAALFKVEGLTPMEGLAQFVTKPYEIFRYLLENLCGRYGAALFLITLFFRENKYDVRNLIPIFMVLILQILTVAAVSGDHVFVHDYYLLAAGLLPIALLLHNVQNSNRNWIRWIFIALCIGRLTDVSFTEIRPSNVFSNHSQNNSLLWSQCQNLKQRNPKLPWNQNYVFRNESKAYPQLGLCFGERSHSKTSSYGFALIPLNKYDSDIFKDCTELDKTEDIVLFSCPQLPKKE